MVLITSMPSKSHKARSLDRTASTSSENSVPIETRSRSEPRKKIVNINAANEQGICRFPDFYSKLLGPTADESILVGIKTLLKVGYGCRNETEQEYLRENVSTSISKSERSLFTEHGQDSRAETSDAYQESMKDVPIGKSELVHKLEYEKQTRLKKTEDTEGMPLTETMSLDDLLSKKSDKGYPTGNIEPETQQSKDIPNKIKSEVESKDDLAGSKETSSRSKLSFESDLKTSRTSSIKPIRSTQFGSKAKLSQRIPSGQMKKTESMIHSNDVKSESAVTNASTTSSGKPNGEVPSATKTETEDQKSHHLMAEEGVNKTESRSTESSNSSSRDSTKTKSTTESFIDSIVYKPPSISTNLASESSETEEMMSMPNKFTAKVIPSKVSTVIEEIEEEEEEEEEDIMEDSLEGSPVLSETNLQEESMETFSPQITNSIPDKKSSSICNRREYTQTCTYESSQEFSQTSQSLDDSGIVPSRQTSVKFTNSSINSSQRMLSNLGNDNVSKLMSSTVETVSKDEGSLPDKKSVTSKEQSKTSSRSQHAKESAPSTDESLEITPIESKQSGNRSVTSWKSDKDSKKSKLSRSKESNESARFSQAQSKTSETSHGTKTSDNIKIQIPREKIGKITEESEGSDVEESSEISEKLNEQGKFNNYTDTCCVCTTSISNTDIKEAMEETEESDKPMKSETSVISAKSKECCNCNYSSSLPRKSKSSLLKSKESTVNPTEEFTKSEQISRKARSKRSNRSTSPKTTSRRHLDKKSSPILQLRKQPTDNKGSSTTSILKSSSSSKTDSYTCTCNLVPDLATSPSGDYTTKQRGTNIDKNSKKSSLYPCVKPCVSTPVPVLQNVCLCCKHHPILESSSDDNNRKLCVDCYTSTSSTETNSDNSKLIQNRGGPVGKGQVRYAITKITEYGKFTTFEIMRSTKKVPKCMPPTLEGVFVLKHKV